MSSVSIKIQRFKQLLPFLTMCAAVILGAVLRFHYLDEGILSHDEALKYIAARDYMEGRFYSDIDHPAIEKYLICLSTAIFGNGEWAIRLPNAILGVVTIALIYLIGKKMFNPWTGALAALLLAFNPLHIGYSTYAKEDALLAFFLTLAIYVYLSEERFAERKRLIYTSIILGFALASKFSALCFPLIFVVAWVWEKHYTAVKGARAVVKSKLRDRVSEFYHLLLEYKGRIQLMYGIMIVTLVILSPWMIIYLPFFIHGGLGHWSASAVEIHPTIILGREFTYSPFSYYIPLFIFKLPVAQLILLVMAIFSLRLYWRKLRGNLSDSAGDSSINGPVGDSHINGPVGDSHINGPVGDSHINGPVGDSSINGPVGDSHINAPVGDSHINGPGGDSHINGPAGDSHINGPVGDSHINRNDLLLIAWLLIPLIAFSALSFSRLRYSIVFMPPLALFCARGVDLLQGYFVSADTRADRAHGRTLFPLFTAVLVLSSGFSSFAASPDYREFDNELAAIFGINEVYDFNEKYKHPEKEMLVFMSHRVGNGENISSDINGAVLDYYLGTDFYELVRGTWHGFTIWEPRKRSMDRDIFIEEKDEMLNNTKWVIVHESTLDTNCSSSAYLREYLEYLDERNSTGNGDQDFRCRLLKEIRCEDSIFAFEILEGEVRDQ